ncbi:hypothetical protein BH09VER1_BH09VER1_40250 [soil metagenome]
MQSGRYKLVRQTGGRGFYADVTIEAKQETDGPLLEISASAFAWLKDVYGPDAWEWPVCDEYRKSAIRGVRYALAHSVPVVDPSRLAITVAVIHASPADTCPDSVALAACFATWNALGIRGSQEPRIVGGKIVFTA